MDNLIDLELQDEDEPAIQHLKMFEQADAQRNQLVKKLCHEIQDLKSSLAQKTLEHNNAIDNYRNLESQTLNAASAVKQSQQSMQNHNHILVLLNGNGCIFHESLLQKGAIGGAEAAYHLHDEIQAHIQNYDGAKKWKVLVRIYVDIDGLLQTLNGAGFKCNRDLLCQFSRGFTQHQPLFDLVDVGRGNEQVDVKMEAFFKLSIESIQCQHILLGYCHCTHLTTLLQPYNDSILDLHRITLLKTTDFKAEYTLKSYSVVEFPSVFKSSDKFAVDLFRPDLSLIEYSASSILTEDSEQSTIQDWPVTRQSSNSSISDQPSKSHRRFSSSTNALIPYSKRSSSWDPTRGIVLLNINDERIDADLGKLDPAADNRVKNRARLCNDYHLCGGCPNPSSCPYSHEPRLSPEELIALRYRARRTPCTKGPTCRFADCWFGHMCFREHCTMPNTCRFKAFHDMDRTAVTVWRRSAGPVWLNHHVGGGGSSSDRWTDSPSDDSLRL